MDIFNRKKLATAQAQLAQANTVIHDLEHSYATLKTDYNNCLVSARSTNEKVRKQELQILRMKDTLAMMDDEIRQLARNKYMNKYIKHVSETTKRTSYFKVFDVDSENGIVQLLTLLSTTVDGKNVVVSKYNEPTVAAIGTMSHLPSITTIIKSKEYNEIVKEH